MDGRNSTRKNHLKTISMSNLRGNISDFTKISPDFLQYDNKKTIRAACS